MYAGQLLIVSLCGPFDRSFGLFFVAVVTPWLLFSLHKQARLDQSVNNKPHPGQGRLLQDCR